jgi:hypothetical protein
MPAIQNRELTAASKDDGHVVLSWKLLPSEDSDTAFFVEYMANGTWRFPTEEPAIGTSAEFTLDAKGPQQFRVIAPDGTPSETAAIDL